MKTIFLTLALCLFMSSAFAQNTTAKQASLQSAGAITIKVPDFADPGVKSFYQAYADHLTKCVQAIREKNEAKATALFKNPGEQLVAREKILGKELVSNAVEKQKYMEFVAQIYPYIKELEHSAYFQKTYPK